MLLVGREICRLLDADADLAAAVAPERRERALQECLAPVLRLDVGNLEPGLPMPDGGGLGLLVLEGLLMRRTGVQGRFSVELLGEGNLIQPNGSEYSGSLPHGRDGESSSEPPWPCLIRESRRCSPTTPN